MFVNVDLIYLNNYENVYFNSNYGHFISNYGTRFGCPDVLTLGKSPIKWRRLGMIIAIDWDVNH